MNFFGFENYTVDIAKGSKDPNEALTSDRAKFTNEVEARIKDPDDYLTSLITRIQDHKDKPQYVPTGFNNLDKLLDGGLYPQLYVLGAVSSVGKTTFSMQIADRIAATQGKTIFYFSLETSKDELTEKNLSRLSFELANESSGNPQTARSINNGYWLDHKPEFKLVMKAINTYSKYYSLIHIFDGTLNRPTANTSYKKMKAYRRKHPDIKPVVIVDYLQILKPIDDKDTDKEKVTKSIAAFKSIASELEIPVIVISSFNRSSYQSPVAMESFKESGEIEYYADTLLGLQYLAIHDDVDNTRDNIREAMQKEPRDIELVVLKNRNGRSNTNINFEYYPTRGASKSF
ncbi:DnaB helicase C-terminal domain-containing protein [Lactobacillus helveticus]|nr:DnaB helicase C-terminal domain-containing protein [Lactobacillus helveticus]